jgi:hypothetical protein
VTPPRFFLAHAKSCTDEELDRLVKVLSKILDSASGGKPFDVVLARAYFEARFKACGSWEAWTAEVATGVDHITRSPLFRAIWVPAGPIGAGTARIVEKACGGGRAVFAFWNYGRYARVQRVIERDRGDWKTGWHLAVH